MYLILADQKCFCFTNQIRQESYLLISSASLDTSPLVFFWLVVVLSNCVQRYFQMHAWFRPSSWTIFLTRCQTLHLSRCESGFPGYISAVFMPQCCLIRVHSAKSRTIIRDLDTLGVHLSLGKSNQSPSLLPV